jgi:hypothetical protein
MLEANQSSIGSNNQFQGIFDGTGHTLTINYDVTYGHAAPFSHISGATIKNLRVAGTIHTTNSLAAGVVGQTRGSSTVERESGAALPSQQPMTAIRNPIMAVSQPQYLVR